MLPVVSVFFAVHQLRVRYSGAELDRRTGRLRVLVDLTEDDDCPIILATCDELPTTVEAWFGAVGMDLPWERMAAAVVQRMRRVHPGQKVISG